MTRFKPSWRVSNSLSVVTFTLQGFSCMFHPHLMLVNPVFPQSKLYSCHFLSAPCVSFLQSSEDVKAESPQDISEEKSEVLEASPTEVELHFCLLLSWHDAFCFDGLDLCGFVLNFSLKDRVWKEHGVV